MNPMKSLFGSLAGAAASAALVVSAVSLPAVAQTAQQGDLAQAVGALRAISTMRADFVQTDRNGQVLTGKLTLKQPGKIRFQYEKGVPLLIVGDGKALTLIDYEVRQVQRWPIKNSPLGALLDPNRDVMKYGRLVPAANPQLIGVEVRDKAHPEYGVITLFFVRNASAPGGLELSSWASLDAQNTRTVVSLANQQYGLAVGDNTFRFNDPRAATRR